MAEAAPMIDAQRLHCESMTMVTTLAALRAQSLCCAGASENWPMTLSGAPDNLLRHPLPVALAVLDAQGQWLDGNTAARTIFTGELAAALAASAFQALQTLTEGPRRVVRWTEAGPNGRYDCSLTLLDGAEEDNAAAGLLSLIPVGEEAGRFDDTRQRAIEQVTGADLWDWDLKTDRVRYAPGSHSVIGGELGVELRVGREYTERVHPDDRAETLSKMTAFLRSGEGQFEAEYRIRHADGHWVWVLARGQVVAWSKRGKPRRMLGSHFDITDYKLLESRVREREALLQHAERLGDTGVWAWDPQRQQMWCSEGFLRISGRAAERAPRDPDALAEQVGEGSRPDFRRALAGLRVGGKSFAMELQWQRPDDSLREVHIRCEALRGPHGEIERLLGVLHDVTDRMEREKSERIRNEMLDRVAQVGRIGGWEINIPNQTLVWTEENYRIHGFPVGCPVSVDSTRGMYEGHSREVFENAYARMMRGEREEDTIEVQFITPAEERVWLRITGRMEMRGGKPYRITGLTRDITAEREASERIEQLAHYDTLTGLPNRFRFRELAARVIQQARQNHGIVALLFLDLDRFKPINDTLGHEAGDQLLLDVAGRLRASVRSGDIVARQSGDEFLVLLRDLKRVDDAGRVARKIIDAINDPVELGEHTVNVGCSIGIALLNDTNPTLEQLLRAADTAMYAAKESGRNAFQFYSDAFYDRVQRKLVLEQELRQAIARDELSLAFQPTINLQDGDLRGIECLARWTGSDGEARSPTEFIPIAEDCGEIHALGRWVLTQACTQAAAWHRAGMSFERIAVNVSAIQLRDPDFANAVIDICEQTGWPSDRLELELTESALMRDSEVLRRAFALFEARGVSLSVDDFGTGFSNLHYLHRFPVKHLKIDRTFIQHLLSDPQMGRLCQAVVGLGHALRLRVVAEGVETEEAATRLRELDCDEAQGYLFAVPMPADELEQWYRRRVADAFRPGRRGKRSESERGSLRP